MGLIIEDGAGSGKLVEVTKDNRLSTDAQVGSQSFYSALAGLSFSAISHLTTLAPGAYGLYVKNVSNTKNFLVDCVRVSADAATSWKLWEVTGSPVGAVLTAANLNLNSGLSAELSVYGDGSVTGLTAGRQFDIVRHPANSSAEMEFHNSLIVGPGKAVAVELELGAIAVGEISIRGLFRDL